MVLFVSLNEIYTLKDICNIIYPPFLDFKVNHSLIEVQTLVIGVHKETDELFGEFHQTVFLAPLSFFTGALIICQTYIFVPSDSPSSPEARSCTRGSTSTGSSGSGLIFNTRAIRGAPRRSRSLELERAGRSPALFKGSAIIFLVWPKARADHRITDNLSRINVGTNFIWFCRIADQGHSLVLNFFLDSVLIHVSIVYVG